jgi:hypothetical protein
LTFELAAKWRREYIDGRIYAMSGGTGAVIIECESDRVELNLGDFTKT